MHIRRFIVVKKSIVGDETVKQILCSEQIEHEGQPLLHAQHVHHASDVSEHLKLEVVVAPLCNQSSIPDELHSGWIDDADSDAMIGRGVMVGSSSLGSEQPRAARLVPKWHVR